MYIYNICVFIWFYMYVWMVEAFAEVSFVRSVRSWLCPIQLVLDTPLSQRSFHNWKTLLWCEKMWQRRLARHGTLLQHDESYDRLIVICLDYGVTLTVGHISCHSFTQGCDDEAEMCDETYEASPCHWWQNVVPIQETIWDNCFVCVAASGFSRCLRYVS